MFETICSQSLLHSLGKHLGKSFHCFENLHQNTEFTMEKQSKTSVPWHFNETKKKRYL